MPPRDNNRRGNTPAGVSRPRQLEELVRARIAARLGRRVRNLVVAVERGVIRLSGQCSTYYSKQLAQHAALGVVEDEAIDNRIEVAIPGAAAPGNQAPAPGNPAPRVAASA